MIVFYTKFNVIDSFDIKSLLNEAFGCVPGMKNVPESFKKIHWEGEEHGEWRAERNFLAFETDMDKRIVAFRIAIVDENDELWTMDIALREENKEIQFRLAREKKIISADYNNGFRIPFLFKKIIRDGIGGEDNGIQISDRPLYINKENRFLMEDIYNNKKVYSLPIVYVSKLFQRNEKTQENYALDVQELARDLAGCAHVLVEEADIASILKMNTEGKNAYNGAVDIFYEDDTFRYKCREEESINKFRFVISHAVYSRISMRNIDEECSLSALRINKAKKIIQNSDYEKMILKLENERLESKVKEADDLIESVSEELKQKDRDINSLQNKNRALQDSLERKNEGKNNVVFLEHTEKDYYEEEIKCTVLKCLNKYIGNTGEEGKRKRQYHILKDIIESNNISDEGAKIKETLMSVLRKNRLNKEDINKLKEIGFEQQKGSHDKYVFSGDDRYIITVSKTPSDFREGENTAHDAVKLIFGDLW